MSGKTVTDRRIDAERKKTSSKCCALYQEYFPEGADEEFWRETSSEEDGLAKALEPRPQSSTDVRKAFHAYTAAFKRACKAGRLRSATGNSDSTHGEGAG